MLAGCVLAAAILLTAGRPAPAAHTSAPQVYKLNLAGVSPPLRQVAATMPQAGELPGSGEALEPRQKPLPRNLTDESPGLQFEDSARQGTVGPLVGTTSLLNFDGISADAIAPPDTNGSAGASQFVEIFNKEYAVFDKTSGALLLGPLAIHTIWKSIGGLCGTRDGGDPIVLYDKMAGRWLVSQLQFTPHFADNQVCVAVSTTSDATGSYNLYLMDFGPDLPDYPKFAVWPDAYYLSVNLYASFTQYVAPEACAFQRSAMLAGATASVICFQSSPSDFGLLPSDLDGATLPPSGEPNFYLELFTDKSNTSKSGSTLQLFKFHADFITPSNSTFAGPNVIPVSPFTLACNGGIGVCVPQAATSQKLEALGDRLMHRLAYRNFGAYEALVVNHSVRISSTRTQTGARWYEIRDPNGTPTVFQQSTFAPDTTNFRWMGSIAQDKRGDMALGYSLSSAQIHPAIHYTGRVPTDALNTMEAEAAIFTGAGSQTSVGRWGDYSSMSIDPADDCTFWYVNQYLPSSGKLNWHTRIASFKFPSCQ